MAGFLLLEIRTLHRTSFDSLVASLRLALRAARRAVQKRSRRFCPVRAPLIQKNQPTGWFFAFGDSDSPSNFVRFTRRLPATRPAGSAARCAKTLPAFLSGPGTTYSEKPALGLVFCFWGAGLFIERRSIHSSPLSPAPTTSGIGIFEDLFAHQRTVAEKKKSHAIFPFINCSPDL